MKFKVTRKINLANIDRDLWPYETEDLGVEDADSFEEAVKMVDGYVRERQGYYRAISDQSKATKTVTAPLPPVAENVTSTFVSPPVEKKNTAVPMPTDVPKEFQI